MNARPFVLAENDPRIIGVVFAFFRPRRRVPPLVLVGEVLGESADADDWCEVVIPGPGFEPLRAAGAVTSPHDPGRKFVLPRRARWWRVLLQRPAGQRFATAILTPGSSAI